ncbi:MAG TPA: thioredoxin domain-containing protein [Opitutaceae bacterium]|nr:thioredoxin domain-containing protein [Opitutaceae bacterium]
MRISAIPTGNLLGKATSPYLRQHAGNPVDWLPWGEVAFARARTLDRPIFLSIGYSTCHWCHVMARESFEDPEVAALLNAFFVPVKVDREERPDVDRLYMAFVQTTTGRGGWPLSVWLTPRLEPFFGGTYFPPEPRWGQPGFGEVLRGLAEAWTTRRAEIDAVGAQAVAHLRERGPTVVEPADQGQTAIARCLRYLGEQFDRTHGGFGGAPKFPRPANLNLLFRALARASAADAGPLIEMLDTTLAAMARGGMRDQLGGGFHRYAVDGAWRVPHFEKMLYDQVQLVRVYLEGAQATGAAEWAEVARDALAYLERDLAAPEGGYYAGEDADSARPDRPEEHGEGAFYAWTAAEFARVCGGEAEEVGRFFGVEPEGNVLPEADPQGELRGLNVLRRVGPWPQGAAGDRLAAASRRLFAARQCRPRPARDGKIVTAWNGLALSALARAAQVLDEPAWREAAVRTARFLRAHLYDADTGRLRRSWCDGRSEAIGFAEDYACLIAGLIDLYEAGGGLEWLQWAETLQERMEVLFGDRANGGYFGSVTDDPALIARLKDDYDGAEPAANSVAALNLLRLAAMLGREDWRSRAAATIAALQGTWLSAPQALPQLLVAVDFAQGPVHQIVLVGRRSDPALGRLAAALHRGLELPRIILWVDGAAEREWFAHRLPWVGAMKEPDGRAAAYVCRGTACLPPIHTPEELARVMAADGGG